MFDAHKLSAVVDNRGLLCAQGIMNLMRTLLRVQPAGLVKVISTDPAARNDYRVWADKTGNPFVGQEEEMDERWGRLVINYIQKRAG